MRTCQKGLERHPHHASARVVLGRILRQQGKSNAAISELKKALEVDVDNMAAHSLLGAIHLDGNDHQAAIEEFQKVLILNPDDEDAQKSLKKAIEKAAGEQKQPKAPAAAPPGGKKASAKESTATLTMAELYLRQGHYDDALEVLQELLADDPHNMVLRKKIAEVTDLRKKEPPSQGAATAKAEVPSAPASASPAVAPSRNPSAEDDSKFTSEEILQVMRRGGKDDAVVEETPSKKNLSPKKEASPAPEPAEKTPAAGTNPQMKEEIKGLLAELSSVSGILRCFLVGEDGIIVVSMGESSNNAGLGKQALAIFQSTHQSVSQLKQGKPQQILVTAEKGHILLVSFHGFVLVVLADSRINLGLLRLSLDSAAKKLEKLLPSA